MTARAERMFADRRVRDAARAVIDADIRHLRGDLARRGIGERVMDRVSESAHDVYDEAMQVAGDNKGALAAIIAALVLWFARHPLLDAVLDEEDDDDARHTDR